MALTINYHYEQARKLAIKKVIKLSRGIMISHPHLDEFVIAMGSYFFIDKQDNIIETTERYMLPDYSYRWRDTKAYFKRLNDFIYKWDKYLKLTGEGIRFKTKGKIVTNW